LREVQYEQRSFEADALRENLSALIDAILRAKPSSSKGRYVELASISSTMGPGIRLDEASVSGGVVGNDFARLV
jgi:large subunit ribosomal protein L1